VKHTPRQGGGRSRAISGPVRPTFAGDLRAATLDGAAALACSALFLAILLARVKSGVDPAAIEMPEMVRNGGYQPYSASQAFGWAALLWSWLGILLGVGLPLLARAGRASARIALEGLHRSMSLTLVALMVTHAVLLVWDKMGDTLVSDFVPWATSYAPGRFPQALGIFSFYLAALLGLTFYWRDRIGPAIWRRLHRWFVPSVYVLALWHTFAYGSDVKAHNWLWASVWAMQAPLVVLYPLRLLPPVARWRIAKQRR
jgi:sulfoxide reductase heme-binding subunit YedZ